MSLSTDVATLAAACRRCLANGTSFTGTEIRLCIDTLETLANTTDSKGVATAALNTTAVALVNTDADALEAEIVAQLALWNAVGAGDSSGVYTTAVAALAPLRTALIASADAAVVTTANCATAVAASVTDITVNNSTDGRAA